MLDKVGFKYEQMNNTILNHLLTCQLKHHHAGSSEMDKGPNVPLNPEGLIDINAITYPSQGLLKDA